MFRFAGPARPRLVLLLVAFAVLASPGRMAAGFTARIAPASALLSPGGSQQFGVYLDSDAGTPDAEVTGFTVRLELAGPDSGVEFTSASMPASGYVFQGNSFGFQANLGGQDPGTPWSPGSPALSITLTDFPDDPAAVSLIGGGSWLLGVVTVGATPNPYGGAVTVGFNRDYSTLDTSGAPLDLAFQNGTIHVAAPAPVSPAPAPGGLALLATALPILYARSRRETGAGRALP